MLKLISFKICPFFQQVKATLAAKNIPYVMQYADFDNCLFDVSPNGKAPVLITESGAVLFDSDAIIGYLETRYPDKMPTTDVEQAALSKAWALQASKNYVAQCSAMRSESKEAFERLSETFKKSLIKMEARMANTPFVSAHQVSQVDIAWLPLLHRAALMETHTGYDFFADLPKIKAWQTSVLALDLVKKSVSEDFENVFTDFYLSEKSYLGSLRKGA